MHELQDILRTTISNGLRRRAVQTPSRWATEFRILGPPIPGPWKFTFHPWLKEVQDCLAQEVVILKAAQMGFTEALLNISFYYIDILRKNVLYVLPTKTPDASDFSSSRFDAALDLNPHLKDIFSNAKNVGHKRSGTANLWIRGSNSRSGLKSLPVALMVFDEYDEMNMENMVLAEARTDGQIGEQSWRMIKLSTPTSPDFGVSKLFEDSTKDHFFFPCPHCGKQTEFLFPESLIITADDINDVKIRESHLICLECKKKLNHKEKIVFLKDGTWQSTIEAKRERRGFHISQLYSSADRATPWRLAQSFIKAQTDNLEAQELYNSKCGIAYVPPGHRVTHEELNQAKERSDRTKDSPAPKNKWITLGADVGEPWIYYEIDAWSFPKLMNDLNMMAECNVLTAGKVLSFHELGQLMHQWQVLMAVVDAQPERRLAYEFACQFYGHAKLCFYTGNISNRMINIKEGEDAHQVSVDKTSWLDVALNRFHNGSISLPKDIETEYCEHQRGLVRRYKKNASGNTVGYYQKVGADHFADTRCYNEIALPIAASFTTNEDIKIFL